MIEIKVPGKLMLVGEWSVLEKNRSCIVVPTDCYVRAMVEQSDAFVLDASTLGLKDSNPLRDDMNSSQLLLARSAFKIALDYIKEQSIIIQSCKISLNSDQFFSSQTGSIQIKFGLGSSAAVVIAVIRSVFLFHNFKAEKIDENDLVFKLASIAHYQAQGSVGSCADIAASTYETTLHYKSFDSMWFNKQLSNNNISISDLVTQSWPGLVVEPIKLPSEIFMTIGFVGASASTKKLIQQVSEIKKKFPQEYSCIIQSIDYAVQQSVKACVDNESELFLQGVQENSFYLRELSKLCGNQLETKALTVLIEQAGACGAVAKFSGAGGGDCGIAFCTSEQIVNTLNFCWQEVGVTPLKNLDLTLR